jgi:hypothetical protein
MTDLDLTDRIAAGILPMALQMTAQPGVAVNGSQQQVHFNAPQAAAIAWGIAVEVVLARRQLDAAIRAKLVPAEEPAGKVLGI